MIKTHEEAVINFTADREELIRESRQNEAYGEEIMTIIKSKCPSILGTDNNIFHLNSKIENIFYLNARRERYDDDENHRKPLGMTSSARFMIPYRYITSVKISYP